MMQSRSLSGVSGSMSAREVGCVMCSASPERALVVPFAAGAAGRNLASVSLSCNASWHEVHPGANTRGVRTALVVEMKSGDNDTSFHARDCAASSPVGFAPGRLQLASPACKAAAPLRTRLAARSVPAAGRAFAARRTVCVSRGAGVEPPATLQHVYRRRRGTRRGLHIEGGLTVPRRRAVAAGSWLSAAASAQERAHAALR
jgi:hypothetical protein